MLLLEMVPSRLPNGWSIARLLTVWHMPKNGYTAAHYAALYGHLGVLKVQHKGHFGECACLCMCGGGGGEERGDKYFRKAICS